jgi:hypothetical protein
MRKMFVMHALAQEARVLQSMFELDIFVEWVSCAAELENRQIRRETVAVYMLIGVRDSGVSFVPQKPVMDRNKKTEIKETMPSKISARSIILQAKIYGDGVAEG